MSNAIHDTILSNDENTVAIVNPNREYFESHSEALVDVGYLRDVLDLAEALEWSRAYLALNGEDVVLLESTDDSEIGSLAIAPIDPDHES